MYRIDYGENADAFINAKNNASASETVAFELPPAVDFDYYLKVDDALILPSIAKSETNTVYEFIMPEHDIKVELTRVMHSAYSGLADTEGSLVFDFYDAPVAVVGNSTYREITINEGDGGMLFLNVYSGSRTKGTTTSHTVYRASPEVLAEVTEMVERYQMAAWNERKGVGITGRKIVVKFRGEDGKLVRVSTENMPEDGKNAFHEINSILNRYLTDSRRIQ